MIVKNRDSQFNLARIIYECFYATAETPLRQA